MHLKYQFEALIKKLMDIIMTGNAPFEFREIALEYLVAFFRHLPHLPHELYFNYDCDPFSSNLLEELLQLFSKNCFTSTLTNQQINSNVGTNLAFSSMQLLSLDALLANLKSLQKAELCHNSILFACPATVITVSTMSTATKESENDSNVEQTSESVPQIESTVLPSNESISESNESAVKVPQDIDVGIIESITSEESEQNHSFVDITGNQIESQSNLQNKNINQIEDKAIEELITNSIDSKLYISYKYPKPENIPRDMTQISQQKQRKEMLLTATEQFNLKPAKGVQYLHENKLISNNMDIVSFLRDNPKLDKKQIGEYLSNKKNLKVLEAFVESFAFKDLRIDEALRIYLESFRLPGEAPLISLVLEHFAHHWHVSIN